LYANEAYTQGVMRFIHLHYPYTSSQCYSITVQTRYNNSTVSNLSNTIHILCSYNYNYLFAQTTHTSYRHTTTVCTVYQQTQVQTVTLLLDEIELRFYVPPDIK